MCICVCVLCISVDVIVRGLIQKLTEVLIDILNTIIKISRVTKYKLFFFLWQHHNLSLVPSWFVWIVIVSQLHCVLPPLKRKIDRTSLPHDI